MEMKTTIAVYIFLVALTGNVLAQQTPQSYYRDHMWGGWHGWFMGPIMMIVFIGFVVALVVLLVKWLGGSGHGHSAQPHSPLAQTPLDILKERFAKGEIDKNEFEEKRKMLE